MDYKAPRGDYSALSCLFALKHTDIVLALSIELERSGVINGLELPLVAT